MKRIRNRVNCNKTNTTHILIALFAIIHLVTGIEIYKPRIFVADDTEPAIDPINVNKGGNVDIRCEASEPIHWVNTRNLFSMSSTSARESFEYIINWNLAKLIEGKFHISYAQNQTGTYITKLHLKDVDYKSAGFYYCIKNQTTIFNPSSILQRNQSFRIYLSVDGNDDDNSVLVDHGPLWIWDSCDVYIPCKPTSFEDRVKLFLNKNGHRIEYMIGGYRFPGDFKINNNDLASKNHFTCSKVNGTISKEIEVRVDRISKATCNGGVTILSKTDNLAIEGGELEFTCIYYGSQIWNSTWLLPNDNNITMGRRLTITNVSSNDIGEYKCIVELSSGRTNIAALNITTILPANKPFIDYTVHSGLNVLETREGKSETWLVHYFTSSSPTLTWYNNKNERIKISSEVNEVQKYEAFHDPINRWTELKVNNLNTLDSGNYTLIIAINGLKTIVPLQLRVKGNPRVKIVDDTHEENGYVIKSCTVYGYPTSKIDWRICDDSKEKSCQSHTEFVTNTTQKSVFEQISTITFKPLSNVTNIYCDARNEANNKIISDQAYYIKSSQPKSSYLRVYLIASFAILCAIAITILTYMYKIRKNVLYKIPKLPEPTNEFPEDNLKYGEKLGSGHYGVVYEAIAKGIKCNELETKVAVKTLQLPSDNKFYIKIQMEALRALMSELRIMRDLGKHLNVVEFLGEISKNILQYELKIIYEFCPHGSLSDIIKKNSKNFINQIVQTDDGYMIDPYITTKRTEMPVKMNQAINPNYATVETLYSSETNCVNGYTTTGYTSNEYTPNGYTLNGYTSGDYNSTGYNSNGYNSSGNISNYNNNMTQYSPQNQATEEDVSVCVPVESVESSIHEIKTTDLIYWSYQVARGMQYLASRNVFHGDLAARNVLLCDKNIVKIGDFGLARSLQQKSFYRMKYETDLPLPWLAIESMKSRVFNIQTDVWSFGITMYELFSLGRIPYDGIRDVDTIIAKLQRNDGLKKPDDTCPQEIFNIMEQCWNLEPENRPSFDDLVYDISLHMKNEDLEQYKQLNGTFVETNLLSENLPIKPREVPNLESAPNSAIELTEMLQRKNNSTIAVENTFNDMITKSETKSKRKRSRSYSFLSRFWPMIPNIYTHRKH